MPRSSFPRQGSTKMVSLRLLFSCSDFISCACFLYFCSISSVVHAGYNGYNRFNGRAPQRFSESGSGGYSGRSGAGRQHHPSGPDVGFEFFGYRPKNYSVVESYQCGRNIKVSRITENFVLTEQPFWDAENGSMYFVDAPKSNVYRYIANENRLYFTKLGKNDGTVSGVIPIAEMPGKYFSTYEDQLTVVTWDGKGENTSSYHALSQPDPIHPSPEYFLGDIKVVPSGAILFYSRPQPSSTTGVTFLPRGQSSMLAIVNGQQKTLLSNLDYGNGIGYSRDGAWLYHSDSIQNVTYKSQYDQQTNTIWNTRVLLNYTELAIPGAPDSLTVDGEGYVWIAMTNGGNMILKVDPNTGDVVCPIKLPAQSPTNMAFGECPNAKKGRLDCIYVTTNSQRLSSPTIFDGAVLVVQGTGSEGVQPYKVSWNNIAGFEQGTGSSEGVQTYKVSRNNIAGFEQGTESEGVQPYTVSWNNFASGFRSYSWSTQ